MKKYIILLSVFMSIIYCLVFVYACSFNTKEVYTYQVGVYKEEENMTEKLDWLSEKGLKGYSYKKDGLYYVISCMSESYNEIVDHSSHIKGVIKKYKVSSNINYTDLIKMLEE